MSKNQIPHVLWLGGASDAGKTTVAQILASKNRWQLYLCDMHEHNHFIARATPDLQPIMHGDLDKPIDELWVFATPEEMFQKILDTNNERFPMICEDLQAMPKTPLILVEGPRLFPKLVIPMLTERHQAIWLLPTDEFAQNSAVTRDKPRLRHRSSDPEKFKANFFERENLLRDYIRQEVLLHQLPYIEITGLEPVDVVADKVDLHFKRNIKG